MLRIHDLQVAYGAKVVLDGLSLDLHPREIHGILGMNGAGKTTLFRTLYGWVKANRGGIDFGGKTLVRDDIAFLETDNTFLSFVTGREYLRLFTIRNEKFQIDRWNEIFELPLDQYVDGYSTGMRKKLAFLGMMAQNRSVMILDEPFNGVDVESNEKICQILTQLKERDRTLILSSHIIHSLTSICDRISFLNGGKIVRTYLREEFGVLEEEIKEWIKGDIDETVRELIG